MSVLNGKENLKIMVHAPLQIITYEVNNFEKVYGICSRTYVQDFNLAIIGTEWIKGCLETQ